MRNWENENQSDESTGQKEMSGEHRPLQEQKQSKIRELGHMDDESKETTVSLLLTKVRNISALFNSKMADALRGIVTARKVVIVVRDSYLPSKK